jgi:predicted dehydrogenase
MSATVRFGILSFAHYHANFWAEAINESPDAHLVGIWDDDLERGADAAQRYNTHFQPELKALLRECDAVGITSETVKHAALVEEAAAMGLHILCEKPMATTTGDCDRIAHAISQSGVIFMQNFPKRYDPINHELVEIVRRGDLGQVTLVRVRHGHFHGLRKSFAREWFVDPALGGGGTLIDEGVHAADFLYWLLGEPDEVYATISNRTLNLPVEDTALAIFSYPSGTLAEVSTGWSFLAAEQSIELYGTKGSALLSGVDLASRDFSSMPFLKVFRNGQDRGVWHGSETTPYFKQGNFHQQGPLYFLNCIRAGKEPVVGLEDGRKSLDMILAAYRAAKSGRRQAIEFSGRPG